MNSHVLPTPLLGVARLLRSFVCASFFLTIHVVLPRHASATEDGFAPLFNTTLNGDFVVAGSYTRVFGAPTPQTDPFTVTLSGIPAGSTIVAAFANWSYLT